MKFLIVTHVVHTKSNQRCFAYEPYVREMNLWLKKVDEVILIAPLSEENPTTIDAPYNSVQIDFRKIPAFSLTSTQNTIATFFSIPKILFQIFRGMQQAGHIHLRCPGNIGLLACILQMFFPSKTKTAKYAGNWDPKASQPWSYHLQKWILSNSFLTRNMKVLVYGEWSNQSKNIVPFFTASYTKNEPEIAAKAIIINSKIKFLFVGSLVEGKNPKYAIRLVEELQKINIEAELAIYGNGVLKDELASYIEKQNLDKNIILYGNQNQEMLKKAYQQSHFVILASKSEGWPKAIAEGMFWGCVPIATAVSCVPTMLNDGERGVLLELDLAKDRDAIRELILNPFAFERKSQSAMEWSRNFTLEHFEIEISKFITHETSN